MSRKNSPGCTCCKGTTGPCGSVCVTVKGGTGCTGSPPILGAMVTLSINVVSSIAVTAAGSGYTSTPSVTISGGGGSGATATATRSGSTVGSIAVTNGGAGYTSAPTVTFSGGGGTGATATATVAQTFNQTCTANGVVTTVAVGSGGSGYTSAPTVTFSGSGGSGATATASIASGHVSAIAVTAGGSGYTGTPTVTFSGGGGSGAAATATIAAKCCINITSAATYTATASFTGFTTGSTNVAAICAGSTPTSTTVSLVPSAAPPGGPGCFCYCPTTGNCPCPGVIKSATYTLSDGFGNVTLTWSNTTDTWRGCALRSVVHGVPKASCSGDVAGSTVVIFDFTCDTLGFFTLEISVELGFNTVLGINMPIVGRACGDAMTCSLGLNGVVGGEDIAGSRTCSPISATFQFTGMSQQAQQIYGTTFNGTVS